MEVNYSNEENTVETPQAIIDAAILRLKHLLVRNYPDHIEFGDGAFTITRGSSQVMIVVRAFTESECAVEFMSNVVTDAKVDNELMAFLLRKNSELHFGAFGLMFDNTVTFTHCITGSSLNSDELRKVLNTVAFIADYYDDIIVDMAGGKRAADLVEGFEAAD